MGASRGDREGVKFGQRVIRLSLYGLEWRGKGGGETWRLAHILSDATARLGKVRSWGDKERAALITTLRSVSITSSIACNVISLHEMAISHCTKRLTHDIHHALISILMCSVLFHGCILFHITASVLTSDIWNYYWNKCSTPRYIPYNNCHLSRAFTLH